MKFDFERTLRDQAAKCQDENLERLLTGEEVDGSTVEPDSVQKGEQQGVSTGALAADLVRRENIQADALSFAIRPSPDQVVKWLVYNAGRTRHGVQPARPVSGISRERHEEIASEVARDARDQLVQELRERLQ
jgi:hypothetical protein